VLFVPFSKGDMMDAIGVFMSRVRVAIAAVILCSAPSFAAAAPATSSTTAPAASGRRGDASAARNPLVQAAIVELTKEIESALRSGEDPPRAHPDYFPAVTAADLPPAAVVAALRRPIGNDPRVQSYVKWQLLSGLPATLDEKTAGELLQAYRAAPPPFPRPGREKAQRDELERMIRNAREGEAEALSERFEQMVERIERDNAIILKYRDALFGKLPVGYDAIAAGFEDAVARMNVGADAAEHVRNVCKALPEWANAGAPPDQLKTMLRAVAQLEKKKGPEYYSRLYWSASSGRLLWSKTQASLASVAQLEDAQEFLKRKIKHPDAPLKLKDER
jgi:hypothetical protein